MKPPADEVRRASGPRAATPDHLPPPTSPAPPANARGSILMRPRNARHRRSTSLAAREQSFASPVGNCPQTRMVSVFLMLSCLIAAGRGVAEETDRSDQAPVDASQAAGAVERLFEQHVRPMLVSKCVQCHGEEKQEGGLRLDSPEGLLAGGDSGPSLVPHDAESSLILEALRYESFEMPPEAPLSDRQIGLFAAWIDAGADWPETAGPLRPETGRLSEEDRQWWAFQPLADVDPPRVDDGEWSRTPIDRFVFRRLADEGLTPAPEADRRTRLRRLYFDLVGVPPTAEETAAFLADDRDDAWERVVDRLLDDPRYGEHWARFWLDLVRYAESDGWNQDKYRPDIWRYRDYVVRSFNRDLPYPEFVRQQLAGDEIGRDNPDDLAATGFLRLGIYEYNQRDARGHWNDIMNETTDVVGDVFLGMSMACARCHDHKFDPVLQKDYFQLRAFFEPLVWRDDRVYATRSELEDHAKKLAAWEDAAAEIREQIDALLEPYYERKWKTTADKFPLDIQAAFYKPTDERTSWEEQMAYLVSRQFWDEGGGPLRNISKEDQERLEALEAESAAFDEIKPKPLPGLMTAADFPGDPSPTVIPEDRDRTPIPPGFLTAMSPHGEATAIELPQVPGSTGRRSALAAWIGRHDNPLTMRVIVNRIWQQHFGQGLVSTPNDFGRKGQPPTHPELLDWLTNEFVRSGGRLKPLHRQILLSATWQQAADHPDATRQEQIDPADTLLWRAPIRRLRAEQIRDAMLQVSGELRGEPGGPSVAAGEPRRGLYVKSQRNTPEPFLGAFDMADGLTSTSERANTTTPTQSLLMINGHYVLGRAEATADRLLSRELGIAESVDTLFEWMWGRPPGDAERQAALRFLRHPTAGDGDAKILTSHPDANPRGGAGQAGAGQARGVEHQRWIDLAHVLLNSNEFIYLD